MNKLAIIAVLLASVSFAHAQDATKPPETPADASGHPPAPNSAAPAPATAPAPPQAVPTKFYLELDQNDINALSAGINELPKRIADPLVMKINGQLTVQAKIAADYTAATTKPDQSKKGKSK